MKKVFEQPVIEIQTLITDRIMLNLSTWLQTAEGDEAIED